MARSVRSGANRARVGAWPVRLEWARTQSRSQASSEARYAPRRRRPFPLAPTIRQAQLVSPALRGGGACAVPASIVFVDAGDQVLSVCAYVRVRKALVECKTATINSTQMATKNQHELETERPRSRRSGSPGAVREQGTVDAFRESVTNAFTINVLAGNKEGAAAAL